MIDSRCFPAAVYLNAAEELGQSDPGVVDSEKVPGTMGVTYELCAGIVDKAASLKQIAKEEIFEECGYDVPLEQIEKITSYR